jgi:glutamate-1-semialdehyde 2,1-aminomutase
MLQHNILTGSGFYPSLAHEDRHLIRYFTAAAEVFAELATAIRDNTIHDRIGGPVRHSGFSRLT